MKKTIGFKKSHQFSSLLRNASEILYPNTPSPFMERGLGGEVNSQVIKNRFLNFEKSGKGMIGLKLFFRFLFLIVTMFPTIGHSETLSLGCTAWGCNDFMKTANVWAEARGHQVQLYENGRLADNLLGLYRQVLAAKSDEFDLILIDTIWPGVLGKHLADLSQYIPQAKIDAHFRPIVENLTDSKGRLVSIPIFTDAGLLYYRKDLLEKYSFEVPNTWEALETIASEIVRKEKKNSPEMVGFVWQGKAYEGLTCNALEWIDSHHGGTIIDSKSGEITINNPKAIRALEMAQKWIGTISPREVLQFTELETTERFRAGHAVFMRHWLEAWATTNDADSPVRGQIGVAALPKGTLEGKHSGTLGDMSLGVSRYSKNVALAAELVEHLTDSESQKRHATEHSFSPTLINLYDDPDIIGQRPFMSALKMVLLNGVARPAKLTGRNYPKISKKFSATVHEILSGQKNASNALEALEITLNRIKGKNGW